MGSSSSRSFSPSKAAAACASKRGGNGAGSAGSESEYVEAVVCAAEAVEEGSVRVVNVGEHGQALLVKQHGRLSALGTKCTHYGAPLASGALGDGRLRCPWHGACFNTATGDIEDFPGLDPLPCYAVSLTSDGQVKIRAKLSELKENKRTKEMQKRNDSDRSTFVIVGGGPSGATCAETLRAEGFRGRLLLVAKENCLPYDRIKVSKIGLALDLAKLQFRTDDYYKKYNIEILKGVEAVGVEPEPRLVRLSTGEAVRYDKLYLAPGSRARRPALPGFSLRNVLTVRDFADASAILSALGADKDKRVVVLGLGFIGLEVAASVASRAASVTLVGKDAVPLQRVFGEEIGRGLLRLFESNGVEFASGNTIVRCEGEGDALRSVELSDGRVLPADLLVLGVGAEPCTRFLEGSGIDMDEGGAVRVDDRLRTSAPDVFAGGDIAAAPVLGGARASIGHVGLAQCHGRAAALNMLGRDAPLRAVPFFWCVLFGKSIRYAGHGRAASSHVIGSVQDLKFVVFFFDEREETVAAASCQWDPVVAQFAELLHRGERLLKSEVLRDPLAWTSAAH